MQKGQKFRGGFALPTVLIASVVMLIVLAVSVSSVAAVRTTLKTQYYEQLAKAAGEAGVAYAKACLSKNANKPLWTDTKPLKPSTDCAGNSLLSPEVQVLAVAGGGGGGYNHGGGGGGGGVSYEGNFSVAAGQSYTAVVGGGGTAGNSGATTGGNGGTSSFGGSVTAQGGGGGGSRVATNSVSAASSGGSGGGGAGTIDGGTGQPGAGAAGFAGQGFAGGNGSSGVTAGNGGGGGGAGAAGGASSGTAASAGVSGAGGQGYLSDISGAIFYYGGGGSGGRWSAGSVGGPGITGGGIGGDNDGVAGRPGQANTGGGGGGSGGGAAGGGAGGSGIVYVRYANNGTITASGGSITPYVSGPYKIHAFKTVGSSSFTVSAASSSACPSDPRCSVLVNDTLRSSFSVSKPAVDADGRALTIPNSGYVELLRSSTGEVWRTYRQPAVQVAAVPDLCSGAASSTLGWQKAVATATKESIPNASSAQTIAIADGNVAAGKTYFRKDFTVIESGTYSVAVLTNGASNLAEAYIDGSYADASQGSLATATVTLSAGCHTITVQLTNKTITPQASRLTAAVQRSGSAPIIATDSSWRVSAGSSVHFSQSDYYADSSVWGSVTDYNTPTAQAVNAAWQGTSGDAFTRMIAPAGNGCAGACPPSSSGYLRDSKDVYVSSATDVRVTSLCDDDCSVYMDGDVVISNSPWSSINQQTMTLTPGLHRFAVRLYNGGSAAGASGAGVSVVDIDSGTVLTRTDRSWQGANVWTSGMNVTTDDIRSYEDSFRPSPDEIPRPTTFDYLVVGGGGGGGANSGGGGGAGGVIVRDDVPASIATYTVTIGAGGAGTSGSATNGAKGANTAFGSNIAQGGGYGASRDGGAAASSGGSGGGGAGATVAGRVPGGSGVSGQGFDGGDGVTADGGVNATGAGGGGAGGAGVNAVSGVSAGNGAAGYITYMTGMRLAVAGGGGGSTTVNGSMGISTDGGGNGTSMAVLNADANTGGGGGGRSGNAAGGNGGSGLVIVRVKTNSVNVVVTGSPATTSAVIQGVSYTIYTFKSSGSFRISAIN